MGMMMSTSPSTFIPRIDSMVMRPSRLVGGGGYRRYVDLGGGSPSGDVVDGEGQRCGDRLYAGVDRRYNISQGESILLKRHSMVGTIDDGC